MGKVRIRLSYTDWKECPVAPAEFEIVLRDPRPEETPSIGEIPR